MKFEDESGAWRDNSSLDFGAGTKNPKKCWVACPKCYKLKCILERTVGLICSNCSKYFSISKDMQMSEEDLTFESELNNLGFAPHILNQELVQYRDKMEAKAYAFKDKQIAKQKVKEQQTFHGPMDEKTGEHIK